MGAFKRSIKAGSVDQSVVLRALNTDGTPNTSIVYNSAGIDIQYRRDLEASTAISLADLAALTTAHADGGFKHIGNGYCRLDLPDAALASTNNRKSVLVHGVATGIVFIGCEIELLTIDIYDSVRAGLTALPNAAAEAAGGLYTRGTGAGQINQPANGLVDVNMERIDNDATAAENLKQSAKGIVVFTVATGSTTKLIKTDLAEATNDHYNDRGGVFITGVCAGQGFRVYKHRGTTDKDLEVYIAMTDAPANGDIGVLV